MIVGYDIGSPLHDVHLKLVISLLLFKFIAFLLYVHICKYMCGRAVSSIEALNQQES